MTVKTDKELRILELQAPSTRKCLERSPDLDFEWLNRKIPKEAQVRDEEGMIFLNHRPISFRDAELETRIRYKRGEHLANTRGEPDAKSAPEEKKLTAVQAFMDTFSPQRIKEKFADLMKDVKKDLSYAEKVAISIKKVIDEK